jgi:hypothetical protein
MPDYRSIDEYLVAIGFNVDYVSQRKFHEALAKTSAVVDKFTRSTAEGFVGIGAAFVGAAATVAGATVGLLHNVAQQDLGMQLYARRMLMSTEAARKMKNATDALGYSLEEIIWGPPELAERYRQLIKDQTEMLKLLGGDEGERAFRKIRDTEFQFTRMIPAMKIFGMKLTEDIINKLAGGRESLEERMKHFVDWFESPEGFMKISAYLSTKLVPFLREVGGLIDKIFTKQNVEWAINVTGKGIEVLSNFISFFNYMHENSGQPGSFKEFWGERGKPGTLGELWHRIEPRMSAQPPAVRRREMALAQKYAEKYGEDPALIEAIISHETGGTWDPRSLSTKGAMGLMQLMPGTAMALGLRSEEAWDPEKNIEAGVRYWHQLRGQHHGDVGGALKEYGGYVTQDPTGYINDILARRKKYQSGGEWYGQQPLAAHPSSFHVDGVNVYLQGTNFTEDDARRVVRDGIDEAHRKIARQWYAQAQGAYARTSTA